MGTYVEGRVFPAYKGSLGRDRSKYDKNVLKAYNAWGNQFSRCCVKNSRSYKTYGLKGIKVEYSRRQLIYWFLNELKFTNIKNPVIGRIDHSKNYCFENIKLEDKSGNSKERINRLGTPFKKRSVKILDINGKFIAMAKSFREAARIANVSCSTAHRILKGQITKPRKYNFLYENGGVS